MSTLRRDLIQIFEGILDEYLKSSQNYQGEEIPSEILEKLADSALELRGFQDKPAFDMGKAGVDWQILAGQEIDQDALDKQVLEKETIDAFESAFSIKGNWNWHPAKPQEMRVWAIFRANLVQLYRVDKDCFTKYVTWSYQPYVKGSMTGRQIKKDPQDFMDSWASFCMSTKYSPRQIVPDNERTDLDDDGIPQSYM